MIKLNDLHPEYITDEKGEKKSVILPIYEFEELVEDIEDLAAVAERREEPTISHEDLITELKRDGLLEDRVETIGQRRLHIGMDWHPRA